MATVAVTRRAEIKTRTTDEVKKGATEVYARWGLSLNDAINTFLIKSIEVGGLPFDLRCHRRRGLPRAAERRGCGCAAGGMGRRR